jgi:hypothetical protein
MRLKKDFLHKIFLEKNIFRKERKLFSYIKQRTYNETTDANSRRHSRGRPWASQGRQNWRV